MNRLEIIHLRSAGEALDTLRARIRASIGEQGEDREIVTLYRRRGLETDLAVHLLDTGAAPGRGPSDLAVRLAAALRSYGLVEHTRWEELE